MIVADCDNLKAISDEEYAMGEKWSYEDKWVIAGIGWIKNHKKVLNHYFIEI